MRYSDCCRFTGLTSILALISNRMAIKMWGEITYSFRAAVEVWEWISNSTPHFVMDVITFAITYFIVYIPRIIHSRG